MGLPISNASQLSLFFKSADWRVLNSSSKVTCKSVTHIKSRKIYTPTEGSCTVSYNVLDGQYARKIIGELISIRSAVLKKSFMDES